VKPFIISAVIGNGRMLATLGFNGELYRLFWPHVDTAQHIEFTCPAILTPELGAQVVRLDDEGNWVYKQEYIDNTNVLKTVSKAKRCGLRVETLDYVVNDQDILVRNFTVFNESKHPIPVVLLYYSSFNISDSPLFNSTCFDNEAETLYHYRRDTWIAVAGDQAPSDYQCGGSWDNFISHNLNGNSLALAKDGCQAWNLGVIEPRQFKSATVFVTAGNSQKEASDKVVCARKQGHDVFLNETTLFWENYFKKGRCPSGASEEVIALWKKSVMVCKLLMNKDSGGIIAAPEFDEGYTACGGYAYCWGRDGAINAQAMLKAGYPDYTREFFLWAAKYQNPAGDWPQRQYTNGQTAPGWGDQVDETGTILWGMWQYYQDTQDIEFIKKIWPCIIKAADFLVNWLKNDTGFARMTWDLWEERFGEHAYTFSAVSAGLNGAGQVALVLGENGQADGWLEAARTVKNEVADYYWDPCLGRFVRSRWVAVNWHDFEHRKLAGDTVREVIGPKGYITYEVFGDGRPDVSLLGLTVPFEIISSDDKKMQSTVENLVSCLTNYTVGGIMRYTDDHYQGGNPWVLTTLWLGMFEAMAGDWPGALSRLQWALKHQTALGMLPEQIDKHSGHTSWVVPLGWSHAMYLLLVNMLSEANELGASSP
jgi:glucoamylase